MEFKEKLKNIQQELKAPKQKPNKFGGYKYRTAEQILAAVKPLLEKYSMILTLSDTIEQVGDRYYIKATAIIEDVEMEAGITVTAYARETMERKKYDDSMKKNTIFPFYILTQIRIFFILYKHSPQ